MLHKFKFLTFIILQDDMLVSVYLLGSNLNVTLSQKIAGHQEIQQAFKSIS